MGRAIKLHVQIGFMQHFFRFAIFLQSQADQASMSKFLHQLTEFTDKAISNNVRLLGCVCKTCKQVVIIVVVAIDL